MKARPTRARVSLVFPLLACVVFPAFRVGDVVQRHSRFSPIDEAQHWDYVQRVASGGVPRLGDRLRDESLREWACRGLAFDGMILPACSAPSYSADAFPGRGFQYEAQHPPLYYALSAALTWITDGLLGLGPVRGVRVTGILWLAAGLLLTWKTGRLLEIPATALAAVALLAGSAPVVVYHAAIVSNDAMAVFCGALVCWVAARIHVDHGGHVAAATAVGVFSALVKATFAIPCVLVGGFLLWQGRPDAFRKSSGPADAWARYGRGGLGLLLGSVLSTVAWVLVGRALGTMTSAEMPAFDFLRKGTVGLASIAREALLVLSPLTDAYSPFTATSPDLSAVLAFFLRLLVLGAALSGCFAARGRDWWQVVGPAAVAGLYAGGFVLGVGMWRIQNAAPGLSGRYGLAVVPLLLLVLGAAVQGRTARVALLTGSGLYAIVTAWIQLQTPLA